jgi:hypothetical protein
MASIHIHINTYRYAEFTLNGVKLAKYARALGLPPEARNWNNTQLLTYFRDAHMRKLIAFVMGTHLRLGSGSPVRSLSEDTVMMVAGAYFGVPQSCFVR